MWTCYILLVRNAAYITNKALEIVDIFADKADWSNMDVALRS